MAEIHAHGEVRSEEREHVLVVTVDRQAKRNAFTPKMMRELAEALTTLDESPDLWAGVLSFAGDHTTAGLEMPLFFGAERDPATSTEGLVDPFGLGRRCLKPLVVAVQGITFTVGLEMMLAGDIAVAASDCRFCQLEAKRGLVPLGGAPFRFLQRAGWGDAMYHLLLCDEFGAEEAHRIGFVQEVVQPGEQVKRAIDLAERIAQNAPLGIQATKAAALAYLEGGQDAAVASVAESRPALFASEDFQEGLASFRERREARFKGR